MFVRPAGRLAWQKLKCWTLNTNCSTTFIIPAMLIDTTELNHFIQLFADFDLAWESQDYRKAKPVGYIFFHICHLIRLKSDVVMKQFKLNILRLFLSENY